MYAYTPCMVSWSPINILLPQNGTSHPLQDIQFIDLCSFIRVKKPTVTVSRQDTIVMP